MKLELNFRENEITISEDEKRELAQKLKDFALSLSGEGIVCCCVKPFANHVKLHIVACSDSMGKFEGSISAPSVEAVSLALWNHFQPQLAKWKLKRVRYGGRERFKMPISEKDQAKCQICTPESCPMMEKRGVWPGKVG